MVSIASSCRLSARTVSRQWRSHTKSRTFRTSTKALAAQSFTMPALSPTMTEGNIASWKVKEGDSFSAGDVLLEVETDKAQMDVEAQDDGKMAKITVNEGTKGIAVGTRIAVVADPEDDLSSLEIPAEESAPKEAEKPEAAPAKPKEQPTAAKESKSEPKPPPKDAKKDVKKPSEPKKDSKHPLNALYPSVQVLLHTHNLNASDVKPTGPNNRLLKGDVLAYLEEIPESSPSELSSLLSKRSHLDLDNIKPAPKKTAPKSESKPIEALKAPGPVSLAVPVSLSAVLQVQKRMQDSLGITLPLSTFIARAIALANEDLPHVGRKAPTQDELFRAVLGLDKIASSSSKEVKDGSYAPQIMALPDTRGLAMAPKKSAKKPDLFDELIGRSGSNTAPLVKSTAALGAVGAENLFSLSVEKKEEKRAKVFLERVKSVLEVEPGRLVL